MVIDVVHLHVHAATKLHYRWIAGDHSTLKSAEISAVLISIESGM